MRTHTIAVCGSGIGGLAAAIALHRRGHQVTLFEKVGTPRPVGSGLMLQPTGQAALARLGLLDQALDHGAILDGIQGKTLHGRTIFDIGYDRLGDACFGLGIHRGTLFHLLNAERERSSIALVTSADIAGSEVRTSKRTIIDMHGTELGAYDLVIDATGLHSPLRQAYARITLNAPYPYGAVWGVCPLPDNWPNPHTLTQRYDAAHTMIGVLPIGRLPDTTQQRAAFFWSLKTADLPAWRAGHFRQWQQRVNKLWPAVEPCVMHFNIHADLAPAAYADVWLEKPFAERLAFVGDAARAASPQLGQGANLALLDAVVLADCLDEHPSVAEALSAYAEARRAHTRFYGLASRWLTPFFQSDSQLAAMVRDIGFAPMARVPYVRKEMVRTLAGLKTGIFRSKTASGLAGAKAFEPTSNIQRNSVIAPGAD